MTEQTFKLLILGLPGIICYFLCQKIIGKPKRTATNTVLLVFLYSILAYTLLSLFHSLYNYFTGIGFESDIINTVLDTNQEISVLLLLAAALSGVILTYLLSYLNHFNIANRFGQWINATKRFGDEDVWHYFHNSSIGQKHDWFIVRDLKADLSYYCNITAWSDSGENRELILYDVSVFSNSTAEHYYDTQHMYLSRMIDDLIIEIPPSNAENIENYKLCTKQKEEKDEQQ